MKRILPYLLITLVLALVVSTITISFNSKKQSPVRSFIPASSRDSFMKEEQARRQLLLNDGSGIDFFSFGIRKIDNDQYFLRLGEFYREPGVSFAIENGKSLYRYPSSQGVQHANYKEEIIPVRYSYDPFLEENYKGAVLIPLTKNNYILLYIFTLVLFLTAVILLLYFGFYKLVRVLLDIAKGNGFTKQNASRLYVAGATFLFVPLIPLVFLQSADWFYSNNIPGGLSFSFFRSLREGYWSNILVGTVLLLTALAFEKGTKMKNELDTVV